MPGSYFPEFDHSTRPSLHLTTANARSPLFLPPSGASATSALSRSHSSTSQSTSNRDVVSRKRVRHNDYTSEASLTPQQATPWTKIESTFAPSSLIYSPVAESPAAFVNTRYRIAGGLDTPSAATLDAEERQEEDMEELDYRPNRMTLNGRPKSASSYLRTPAVAATGGQPRRKRAHSSDQSGWGRAVVNLVGGVAGKVFDFCWNSAFRGFQAGGGEAYRLNSDTPGTVRQSTWTAIGEKDDVFNKHYESQRYQQMTPVPGEFPEEGFIDDYMLQPQAYRSDQPLTPVPRRDTGWSAIKGDWVIVNSPDGIDERARSPALSGPKKPRPTYTQRRSTATCLPTVAGNRPRLAPSRPFPAGSPASNVKRPASFASPRASPSRPSATEAECHAPSSPGHRRTRSSRASPRRAREIGPRPSLTTPVSPDVQRFEKKIRRKERREDENIQRLNKQLQDMIKEGKEALGTRIEIEDDLDDDEGYGEGTEMIGASKW